MTHSSCLFHYTSIKSFEEILKNKTIRFTRSDLLNDGKEVNITDMPEIKPCVFISSWTKLRDESPVLWEKYGDNKHGVRIKLPYDMFRYETEPFVCHNTSGLMVTSLEFKKNRINHGRYDSMTPYVFGPIDVKYKDNNSISIRQGNGVKIEKIPETKTKDWEDEQESRYFIASCVRWDSRTGLFAPDNKLMKNTPIDEFCDIPLNKDCINKIEIILGPDATDHEKKYIKVLLCEYTSRTRGIDDIL